MTHFTLHIFTTTAPTEEDLETILHPFDENEPVEPYIDTHYTQEEAEKIYNDLQKEKPNHPDITTIHDALNYWTGTTTEPTDDGGYNKYTTRNPNSKWDWWQIGGRWDNRLETHTGGTNHTTINNLAFTNIIATQKAKAEQEYNNFLTATHGLRMPPTMQDLLDQGVDHDKARYLINSSPWEQAAQRAVPNLFMFARHAFHIDRGGKEAYILEHSTPDVPTAYIDLDGNWHERGEIGWLGYVNEEEPLENWVTQYRNYLQTLPPTTHITLIDCHI